MHPRPGTTLWIILVAGVVLGRGVSAGAQSSKPATTNPTTKRAIDPVATQPLTLPTDPKGGPPSPYRRDLSIPRMELTQPAPGKRVRLTLPEYENTEVFASLYLPTDWQPGNRYPVIVEYQGNGGAIALPGRYDSCLGYGLSGGVGFIWVCVPYISPEKTQQTTWWGDVPATLDFCKRVVRTICEHYGGDGSAVFLTGFSRGAIACNYLGLHDDEIADIWLAFLPHSHYEGKWPGSKPEDRDAMLARLARLRGRASFVSNEGPEIFLYVKEVIAKSDAPFTLVPLPHVRHTNTWVLEDCPQRRQARDWLADVLSKRPGTHDVSGRVTDAAGNGIEGVRVEAGYTRWTFTGPDGRYTLHSLPAGGRTLTASKRDLEFENAQLAFTITAENVPAKDFRTR